MIKTKKYAIIILLYTLAQSISTLIMRTPNSLAVYISFCFTSLYTLYFYKNRKILDWVLSISIPSIILFLVIFIVSSFFADYNVDESIVKKLNGILMIIFPTLALSLILFLIITLIFKWIDEKRIYGWFIGITFFIYFIIIIIYGTILSFIFGLTDYNYTAYYDIIASYSFVFIYFPLPLILTIHAHINQRNIEKYFHLFYMVFAPMMITIFDFYLDEIYRIQNITLMFVIIPPLFALKNLYLSYRQYKGEKKNLRKDKGDNLKENKD
ncbi:hypothetical protein [Helicobacter apodemus]|uniref:Uncharacterized protein n=1 Tax=Helicobacter apodemus TaxID=135569 RepID=A0A2U8FB04_9HELI|nr:hypothetical protein [Helicobacter apodemus]AWI33336.1 hypothetical protein CDV25_00140 [Helicobacter apodemus]